MNNYSHQKMLKAAQLKETATEYKRNSATQLTPGSIPNITSVFGINIVGVEDRHDLLLASELADGDMHWSDPVARVHKQIPIFATTVVV